MDDTPRLPVPGEDSGEWGDILNRFLSVSLDTGGIIKANAVTNTSVSGSANIAQSKIANLTTDLGNKQPLDSDLTAVAALSPTDNDVLQRKSGAWTNRTPAQLKTDLTLDNVNNTTDLGKPVSTATQTALDAKASVAQLAGYVALVGSNIATLPNSTGTFVRINVPDDGSNTATWPDRFAFYFNGTRSGYFNEYGELRARPGKTATVPFRAMAHASGSAGNVLEVSDANATVTYFGVSATQAVATVPITAPNIGVKVSTGTSAPVSPSLGDVWIDTN